MTIKELYDWAEWNNVENFDIEVEINNAYKSVDECDLEIDRFNVTVYISK
jgi:hypothetical protein